MGLSCSPARGRRPCGPSEAVGMRLRTREVHTAEVPGSPFAVSKPSSALEWAGRRQVCRRSVLNVLTHGRRAVMSVLYVVLKNKLNEVL